MLRRSIAVFLSLVLSLLGAWDASVAQDLSVSSPTPSSGSSATEIPSTPITFLEESTFTNESAGWAVEWDESSWNPMPANSAGVYLQSKSNSDYVWISIFSATDCGRENQVSVIQCFGELMPDTAEVVTGSDGERLFSRGEDYSWVVYAEPEDESVFSMVDPNETKEVPLNYIGVKSLNSGDAIILTAQAHTQEAFDSQIATAIPAIWGSLVDTSDS